MDKEFELARLVPQSCSSVGWIGGSFFACFRGLVWISHYLCSMQSAFKLTTQLDSYRGGKRLYLYKIRFYAMVVLFGWVVVMSSSLLVTLASNFCTAILPEVTLLLFWSVTLESGWSCTLYLLAISQKFSIGEMYFGVSFFVWSGMLSPEEKNIKIKRGLQNRIIALKINTFLSYACIACVAYVMFLWFVKNQISELISFKYLKLRSRIDCWFSGDQCDFYCFNM